MSYDLPMTENPVCRDEAAERPESALRSSLLTSPFSLVTFHIPLLALFLASCGSHDKKPKADYSSMKWEQRLDKQIKDPFGISSPFQKQVYNSSGTVKTSKFKATEYHGEKGSFFGGK